MFSLHCGVAAADLAGEQSGAARTHLNHVAPTHLRLPGQAAAVGYEVAITDHQARSYMRGIDRERYAALFRAAIDGSTAEIPALFLRTCT